MLKSFYKKGARGFTLIELLVVIAIIGVLASIVLASLNTARKKSRDARRLADIKQVQLALELYFDGNSSTYPLTLSLAAPTFIPQIPKDPSSASLSYNYDPLDSAGAVASACPTCTSYHLGATLAEHANPALANDSDTSVGFYGLGKAAEATACPASTDGGVAADETCYDVKP